jgi:CMP-N-acetylneuraminic acid synthetase
VGLVEIPISSSIDIDEYEDLALAELIMKGKVVI